MDLKKRLNSIVQKNKENNLQYLMEVIKSDLYYLLNNYFELDLDDINLNISLENNKYLIDIKCLGDRIKMVKVLH